MNTWIYYIILFVLNFRAITNISEKNTLKIDAGKAFYEKNYALAIEKYKKLEVTSLTLEPEARLNLAHAYYRMNDKTNALNEYEKLIYSTNPTILSTILSQIGVIKVQEGDSLQALNLFKEALQKEPNNNIARYNFELIKKKLPPEPPNNKNKQNTENENQSSLSGQTQHSDKREEDLASTTPQKMSKEKALQILEAMKSSELQYMQQKKISSSNQNQVDKDW